MENVFDALCTSLHAPAVKTAFLDGEGIELMCLMLKEKKLSRTRAIKTLDHALQGQSGIALCEKFVELLGLKTLFSAFMGKVGCEARPIVSPFTDRVRDIPRTPTKRPRLRSPPRLMKTRSICSLFSPRSSPPSPPTRLPVSGFSPNLWKAITRRSIG